MEKRQVKAIANAKAQVAKQAAHAAKMEAAGQPEAAVRAAKRLVITFTLKVEHLESGADESTFDYFNAGKVALAAYPFVGKVGR